MTAKILGTIKDPFSEYSLENYVKKYLFHPYISFTIRFYSITCHIKVLFGGYPKVRKGVLFAKRTPFREKDPFFTKRTLFIINMGNADMFLKWQGYECLKKSLSNIL